MEAECGRLEELGDELSASNGEVEMSVAMADGGDSLVGVYE